MSTTFDRVVDVLATFLEPFDDDLATVTTDTTLESLGFDSLDEVEIMMDLEEAFDVEIDVLDWAPEGKLTIGMLVDQIERLTRAGGDSHE
jgi:acyl carrier protein